MIRSSFLRRTLLLVMSTILVFALLIAGIYSLVSPQIFAAEKIADMLPQGRLIAETFAQYLSGQLPSSLLVALIGTNTAQWDATVWVVDLEGETILRTQQKSGRRVGTLPEGLWSLLPDVLSGQECTHIGVLDLSDSPPDGADTSSNSSSGHVLSNALGSLKSASDDTNDSAEQISGSMVAVAVPVFYGDQVQAAVFMAQSMDEVVAGMDSLTNALMIAVFGVALLMLPTVFFFAFRLARPMRQMRDVALAMTAGDFTVRADEGDPGEIGSLGCALNMLSSELGRSISALRVESNRLRSTLNGLSEGIIAVDAQGAVTHANPAVRALFHAQPGLQAEGMTGSGRLALVSCGEVWDLYDEVLRTGQPHAMNVHFGDVVVRASVSPLEGEHGRFAGAVGVLSDITASERLEQTRRDYVANVSHELRTPLTAMRGLIEPLRDGLVKDEEQRQHLYDIILRETMRLSRLVSDMLELSRLQSGTCSLEKRPFNPGRMLRSVFDAYAQYADDYGQTLRLHAPDALPDVLGNPDRTEQVLVAILDNAMKYTPEGGTIDLIAEPTPELLRVTVKDTGPGIAQADLPHVFERFYKADKAHQGKGTGLGLAIAHEIMKQLGEELTVHSVQGEGSAFTFTLHFCPQTPPSQPLEEGASEPALPACEPSIHS